VLELTIPSRGSEAVGLERRTVERMRGLAPEFRTIEPKRFDAELFSRHGVDLLERLGSPPLATEKAARS
jgi:hypothetical protein